VERVKRIADDPVQLGFWSFTLAVSVQALHQVEHLAQIIQKNVLGWSKFPGLLGAAFDFETVHFLYNLALFLSVAAVWIVYYKNPGIWRRSSGGLFALSFALVFQGYHLSEHTVRIIQYAGGTEKPPGVVGQIVPSVELHFWINSLVIGALIVAYILFRPTPARAWVAAEAAA
jgi:hypothetical protein